jgi:hypothetical protein
MLVKRAFETNGIVKDCDTVLEASKKYRCGQDHIAGFVLERIRKTNDTKQCIKKRSLLEEFNEWFKQEHNSRKMPKGEELCEYMNKKFGAPNSKGWVGLEFIREEDEDDIIDNFN